jgi:transcriptional regulator of acetoin/glycerol metabolism
MTGPQPSPASRSYQRGVLRAREDLDAIASGARVPGVRPAVLDSWRRSLTALSSATSPSTSRALDGSALSDARRAHAFGSLLPLVRDRLVEPITDAGMIVALTDAQGHLLWVEGSTAARTRAESMGFAEGADWSEDAMGTSAPALALRTGDPVQVSGAEHFAESVHPWSCSAVPVRDPHSGALIGVLDVTGGTEAVSPLAMPLLRSTARSIQQILQEHAHDEDSSSILLPDVQTPLLQVTGRRRPVLHVAGHVHEVSLRHAELLLLLARAPEGTTGSELAEWLHGSATAEGTVRAELVRLRRFLSSTSATDHGQAVSSADPRLTLLSRPYRLAGALDTDVGRVESALSQSRLDDALAAYQGPVLPESEAPIVRELRDALQTHLRDLVLERGTWQQVSRLVRLPDVGADLEALMTLLRIAPADAPERAEAVVRAEALEHG